MKVTVVQNVLAPYRVELFESLEATPGIDLTVLVCFAESGREAWSLDGAEIRPRFGVRRLGVRPIRIGDRVVTSGPAVFRSLVEERPDVIISGELSTPTLAAIRYSKLHGAPVLVWWAGTALTEKETGFARRLLRRWMLSKTAGALAYSEAAAVYLASLGVPRENITVVGNVTFDAAKYRRRVEARAPQARSLREATGMADASIILSVGRLIPSKNYDTLIDVMSLCRPKNRKLGILIVGEGPLQSRIEARSRGLNVGGMMLAGKVPPAAMPTYYAAADVFVHLSLRDRWSQAVNEALASALPVVMSKYDHASEVLRHGWNGFVVDPGHPPEVAQVLEPLIESSLLARSIGERGFQALSERDLRHSAAAFLAAIRRVGGKGHVG